jgi:hypothetical protein
MSLYYELPLYKDIYTLKQEMEDDSITTVSGEKTEVNIQMTKKLISMTNNK